MRLVYDDEMRLPLYIDFNGKKVLILGGGVVGFRRAKRFLEAGAHVTVYSVDFIDEFEKLENVCLIRGDVKDLDKVRELISNSDLVVVALPTREYNETICELARSYKVLVNLANDSKNTEVLIPLERRFDDIRVTVTSEGKSVLVSREVMRVISKCISSEDIRMVEGLMLKIKSYVIERYKDHRIRNKIYRRLVEDEDFNYLISLHRYEEALNRARDLIDKSGV